MKARIKATGEIVELAPYTRVCEDFAKGRSWLVEELDDADDADDADDVTDYWTRLEHQAAIAAMQGTLANADLLFSLCKDRGDYPVKVVAIEFANACAHALVEKLKEKEEK